jgi:hypothetical protein
MHIRVPRKRVMRKAQVPVPTAALKATDVVEFKK